ncbi:MAG: 16S rRNA processing protein RimM [Gemmatimonadaceae bacterium]|nr:16S rRNA processing protein RimM [Gemmatimonadaceae bacterium]
MVSEIDLVIVGKVRKAQGIKGELLVESLSDSGEKTFAAGKTLIAGTASGDVLPRPKGLPGEGPIELAITRSRPFKGGWLVIVEGIKDRTDAEKWRGRYLLAPRSELDPPGENEVYLHDLIGVTVESAEHDEVGKVTGFYELPQGLMLEVRTAAGDTLVPYRAEVIAHADMERRVLTLHDGVDFIS